MGIINVFINSNSRPGNGGRDFLDLNGTKTRTQPTYVTPLKHIVGNLLIKLGRKSGKSSQEEIMSVSRAANVRCMDCGWKYNFNSISHCPVCSSERTYLLMNGSFIAGFLTISTAFTIIGGVLILIYQSLNR